MVYDCIIIGGGVTGAAIARFLSRYELNALLLEKNSDLCTGTSKANSGIVHAGYDPLPGTLKAKLNVRGNELIRELAPELDIDLVNNGALVLSFDKNDEGIQSLYERGKANGVPDMRILHGSEIQTAEPNVSAAAEYALYLPTSCIVCPFSLTLALAENAYDNGVCFALDTKVDSIERINNNFMVHTSKGTFESRTLVNAAGVYADEINNMVSPVKIRISARRGEYMLLDKTEGGFIHHTLFQLPTKEGKGVLVTPTAHGNLLIGPDNVGLDDKENTSTTAEGLLKISQSALKSTPGINLRKVITSFSGLRAHPDGDDFIINEPIFGFFNAAGIESPGLSAAPAVGEMVASMVAERLSLKEKKNFKERREGIKKVSLLSDEERSALIKENPLYGNIICRCEEISEGEIVESLQRPFGPASLDGIKRRVRAGMGRCQAGFCSVKVMEIISRERGIPLSDIRKNEAASKVLL